MSGEEPPMETASYLNKWYEQKVSYNKRDLLTYAVGIGCTELNFVYENHPDFSAFPTYPIVLNFKGTDQDVVSFPSEAMTEGAPYPPLPGVRVGLDGERYLECIRPLDTDGEELTMRSRVIGVHKRGSGASVETEALIVNSKGETIYKLISGAFMVGANGFKDSGVTNSEKIKVPSRAPDAVVDMETSPYQAQIYRISGDYNPLHVDPEFAQMSGFKKPILHGLCSFGMSARAVIQQYCPENTGRFRAIKARFASPVLPGQTLSVHMWKEGNRVLFLSKVKETGKVAVSNAYVELHPESKL